MIYILLVLFLFSVSSIFWFPRYSKNVITKANPQILERIMVSSDGSSKDNRSIQQILLGEGYISEEIGKALMASAFVRQKRNIVLAPIFATIACVYLILKILY